MFITFNVTLPVLRKSSQLIQKPCELNQGMGKRGNKPQEGTQLSVIQITRQGKSNLNMTYTGQETNLVKQEVRET